MKLEKRVKRTLCCMLALFCLPLTCSVALAGEAAPEGAVPPAQYSVADGEGTLYPALQDGQRGTAATLQAGSLLEVDSEAPFTHLYLVWDRPPAPYTLRTEAGAGMQAGENGFLHEAVALPESTGHVTLELAAAGDARLCDIWLFEGGLPGWVQQWQPPVEKADLLALPTHADDEHLFFGGTLPTYAGQQGMAVQVAYLTNHWEEPYRPHELLDGLWTVGVTAYPVISDFPDLYADSLATARGLYDEDAVMVWQVEQLRRFKPDVVVAHDIDGEYGHGVHILNATTLLAALEEAPDDDAYPQSAAAYGTWDVPKTYLHLWPERPVTMDWDVPLERFGGATAFEVAQAGFARHTSQQAYFAVEQQGPYDCRLFGLARTTVGEDSGIGDFFEHIEPAAPEAESSAAETPQSGALESAPASAEPQTPASRPGAEPEPAPEQAQEGQLLPEWAGIVLAGGLLVLAVILGVRYKLKGGRP